MSFRSGQAKRAKGIGKRARRAKDRGATHEGDATGAVVVTQTKKGEELTSRKSHKPVGRKEGRNADDIEDGAKKAKSGQAGWEETNEEVLWAGIVLPTIRA